MAKRGTFSSIPMIMKPSIRPLILPGIAITLLSGPAVAEDKVDFEKQLLPVMENAHQVVLSEFAHTGDLYYLQRDATRHLLQTFFETGEVDDSRFQPHAVNFEPDWGLPLITKLAAGGVVLIVVLAAAALFFLVRWVRRFRRRRLYLRP